MPFFHISLWPEKLWAGLPYNLLNQQTRSSQVLEDFRGSPHVDGLSPKSHLALAGFAPGLHPHSLSGKAVDYYAVCLRL
jgi:hypothetical protein